jgi:hypothetical protein
MNMKTEALAFYPLFANGEFFVFADVVFGAEFLYGPAPNIRTIEQNSGESDL